MTIPFRTIQIECFDPNIEYNGQFLGNPFKIQGGAKECHAQCVANANCKFFVFRNNDCLFLKSVQNKNNNANAISGKRDDICPAGKQK